MSNPAPATQEEIDRVFSSITIFIVVLRPKLQTESPNAYQVLQTQLPRIRRLWPRLSSENPDHLELLKKIFDALKGKDDSDWPDYSDSGRLKEVSENLTTQKEKDKNVQKLLDELVEKTK